MSEFSGGKTRIRRPPTAEPTTEINKPEFSTGTGVVTVTRFLQGPPGQDADQVTPEDTTLAYDVDGKLTSVTKPSGVTTLTYDVDGKLVTVTSPTHTKTLTYDVDDRLILVDVL